jgi:hypothetical protein
MHQPVQHSIPSTAGCALRRFAKRSRRPIRIVKANIQSRCVSATSKMSIYSCKPVETAELLHRVSNIDHKHLPIGGQIIQGIRSQWILPTGKT